MGGQGIIMDSVKWALASSLNTSPDKTVVKSTSNSISVKNKGCKGTMRKRSQCTTCGRKGTYQMGIFAWGACCNRDDGWRRLEGELKKDKPCEFYIIKESKEDVR